MLSHHSSRATILVQQISAHSRAYIIPEHGYILWITHDQSSILFRFVYDLVSRLSLESSDLMTDVTTYPITVSVQCLEMYFSSVSDDA
jgi:hypothetical protein